MSFDGLLNKSCTIQTATTTQDAGGQMVKSWANTLTGVKCRLSGRSGNESRSQAFDYYKASHLLFLRDPGVTITTADNQIVIDSTEYKIMSPNIIHGQSLVNHIELMLDEVK